MFNFDSALIKTPSGAVVKLYSEVDTYTADLLDMAGANDPKSDLGYRMSASFGMLVLRGANGEEYEEGEFAYDQDATVYVYPLCEYGERYHVAWDEDDGVYVTLNGETKGTDDTECDEVRERQVEFIKMLGYTESEFYSQLDSIACDCAEELHDDFQERARVDYAVYSGGEVVQVRPHWMPYFINSDPSGLTEEDIAEADEFDKQLQENGFEDASRLDWIYPDAPAYFSKPSFLPSALLGDVVDCLVMPRKA